MVCQLENFYPATSFIPHILPLTHAHFCSKPVWTMSKAWTCLVWWHYWSEIISYLVLHGGLWYFILYCIVWYIKLWDGIVSIVWQGIVCWEHIIARYCMIERPHNVVLYNYSLVLYGWETAALDLTLEFVVAADLLQVCALCTVHFLSHPTVLLEYIQGVFFHWSPPKKLKYGKPRLGESTAT